MTMISPTNKEVQIGQTLKEEEYIGMVRREILDDFLRQRAKKNGPLPSRSACAFRSRRWTTTRTEQRCMYVGEDVSPDFYAWVFPKSDHVAVGTGTVVDKKGIQRYQQGIRERAAPRIEGGDIIRVEAHPIPEHPRPWRVKDRAILVGDAAGYVTKCSGEGIYFAAKSGRMCAETIVKNSKQGSRMIDEADLMEHLREWDGKYGPTYLVLDLLQKIFYTSDAARESFVELCEEEYVQKVTFDSYLYKTVQGNDPVGDLKLGWKTLSSLYKRRSILDHLCEDASSSSSSQAKPPRVSQLSERALGFAGNMAARAKQGISEMAPEASTKTAAAGHVAATEMKRAAARASHAAGWARHSMNQAADKAAATKSAEYAKTAANSALSAARVQVAWAASMAAAGAQDLGGPCYCWLSPSRVGIMADGLVKEQVQEFYDTFKLFDEDKDDRLSLKEFGTLLSSLGQNPTEQELQEWIGGDGEHDASRIDFHTFLSLMSRKLKETDTEEELIEAFKVFDRDRDGFISGGELRASMTNLGERLNDTEVDEMIREADQDGDGLINYDEFVRMMMATK
eukprot:s3188_g5.t1